MLLQEEVNRAAKRVQAAECEAYPAAVRLFCEGRLQVNRGRVQISD